MRVVFLGAGEVSQRTARILVGRRVEVVIIESNRDVIDQASEQIDCGWLHGDGSKPAILREANPKQTDLLFCLTDNDQTNIIASLIGRSLGFGRIITSVKDDEFEPICLELGLADTIVPSVAISRHLADIVSGVDNAAEMSTAIKGEARLFAFVLNDPNIRTVEALQLPPQAKVVCFYRAEAFQLAEDDSRLRVGDEIVVLTHSQNLAALRDRWEADYQKQESKRTSASETD
jgi:trk system potassium uptake protein TrkA